MILIKGLTLKYISNQDIKFIKYPNITFQNGKINLLIGKNGSGKSTLGNYFFKIGSIEKTVGNVFYDSIELSESLVNHNYKFVPQERPLMHNLTCNEIWKLYHSSKRERIINGLSIDKVFSQKKFSTLSTGEWKKFLLQNILSINNLNGIFLDEIFAGLQNNTKEEIIHLLVKNTIDRNLTTIITHINLENENTDFLVHNLNKFKNYVNKIYLHEVKE